MRQKSLASCVVSSCEKKRRGVSIFVHCSIYLVRIVAGVRAARAATHTSQAPRTHTAPGAYIPTHTQPQPVPISRVGAAKKAVHKVYITCPRALMYHRHNPTQNSDVTTKNPAFATETADLHRACATCPFHTHAHQHTPSAATNVRRHLAISSPNHRFITLNNPILLFCSPGHLFFPIFSAVFVHMVLFQFPSWWGRCCPRLNCL